MINLIELDTNKTVNSGFGLRESPTAGASSNHKGIDITLADDNIPSVLSGIVTYVGYSDSGGNMVKIAQNDGTTATYMHMAAESPLKVGQTVYEGQTVGIQGSTGVSTGKHLHLSIQKDGEYIDPEYYLTNTSGSPFDTRNIVSSVGDGLKDGIMGIVGKVVYFLAIILVIVLAIVLFMKAFDIKIL